MEQVEVRKRAGEQCVVGVVVQHVGQVAGHVAHEVYVGALEALPGLRFGVDAVAEDGDVDAHERVDCVEVGGGLGVGGVGGVEAGSGWAVGEGRV